MLIDGASHHVGDQSYRGLAKVVFEFSAIRYCLKRGVDCQAYTYILASNAPTYTSDHIAFQTLAGSYIFNDRSKITLIVDRTDCSPAGRRSGHSRQRYISPACRDGCTCG
ncbi:hypothetical protein D3C85_1656930 [compost metagenome]